MVLSVEPSGECIEVGGVWFEEYTGTDEEGAPVRLLFAFDVPRMQDAYLNEMAYAPCGVFGIPCVGEGAASEPR